MTLQGAVGRVLAAQTGASKPLGIILAGHNGSGKSTLWREHLADHLRVPLINADRMMLSILPEANTRGFLVDWAASLRDTNTSWLQVTQSGVQSFVGHAMAAKLPFAMETVFSHWRPRSDGTVESKLDLIGDMQNAGYFVLLLFVGLPNANYSIMRVQTRVSRGGHDVPPDKLRSRFPNTQRAIAAAATLADATILTDNSHEPSRAFTVCRLQQKTNCLYDIRTADTATTAILEWMSLISPDVPP